MKLQSWQNFLFWLLILQAGIFYQSFFTPYSLSHYFQNKIYINQLVQTLEKNIDAIIQLQSYQIELKENKELQEYIYKSAFNTSPHEHEKIIRFLSEKK